MLNPQQDNSYQSLFLSLLWMVLGAWMWHKFMELYPSLQSASDTTRQKEDDLSAKLAAGLGTKPKQSRDQFDQDTNKVIVDMVKGFRDFLDNPEPHVKQFQKDMNEF